MYRKGPTDRPAVDMKINVNSKIHSIDISSENHFTATDYIPSEAPYSPKLGRVKRQPSLSFEIKSTPLLEKKQNSPLLERKDRASTQPAQTSSNEATSQIIKTRSTSQPPSHNPPRSPLSIRLFLTSKIEAQQSREKELSSPKTPKVNGDTSPTTFFLSLIHI